MRVQKKLGKFRKSRSAFPNLGQASLNAAVMFELPQTEHVPADGFFLERLDAFMQRSLADIKAFSLRENKPFEEVCRLASAHLLNR